MAAGVACTLSNACTSTDVTTPKSSPIAAKPLRLLILGGTGFIGPHHVRIAVARGHHVAVFNRGTDNSGLPDAVEQLIGDRDSNLEAIKNRDWDAVIDLPTYGPSWVRSLGAAIRDRTKHYTFISTNAVYDNPGSRPLTTEESPLLTYTRSEDPYSITRLKNPQDYGPLKVLCEREAEKQFPGRTLIARPGWIFGPGYLSPQFIYWPARMQSGVEIMAAGDPSTPIQFIDVRDVAEWVIRSVERSTTGIYNILGPAESTNLGQLVDAARTAVSNEPKKISWVPSSLLTSQQDRRTWSNLLFWTSESEGFTPMMRMSIQKALANGLAIRPISSTFQDAFRWYKGLSLERQAELLTISWDAYLKRESEILSAWNSNQKRT